MKEETPGTRSIKKEERRSKNNKQQKTETRRTQKDKNKEHLRKDKVERRAETGERWKRKETRIQRNEKEDGEGRRHTMCMCDLKNAWEYDPRNDAAGPQ